MLNTKHKSNICVTTFMGLLFSAAALFSTSCSKGNDEDGYKITFENVDRNLLAGPTSYGENLYSQYEGTEPARYLGYTDNTIGLTFHMADEFWSGGIAISTWNDKETAGYRNQCSVYYGDSGKGNGGHDNSATFAVGNMNSYMSFDADMERVIKSAYFTNGTYASLSMMNSDESGAKKHSYEGKDWFKLIIEGYDKEGKLTGKTECMLSDFREKNSPGILTKWQKTDLSCLGKVNKVIFKFEGSDIGQYGLNTPAYFCMDDIIIAEELN